MQPAAAIPLSNQYLQCQAKCIRRAEFSSDLMHQTGRQSRADLFLFHAQSGVVPNRVEKIYLTLGLC